MLEDRLVREFLEICRTLVGVGVDPGSAFCIVDDAGDIDDVGAGIAVFGKLGSIRIHVLDDDLIGALDIRRGAFGNEACNLQIAKRHGLREDVHLVARVVDVELAGHVIACEGKDVCHRIAERCPTAMSQMHGTCRVGGNELEVDLDAIAVVARAVKRVLTTNHAKHALQCGIGELDVDETGAGDFDGGDFGRIGNMRDDDLRDVTGIHVCLLGASHGNGTRPIAMRKVTRTLDLCRWQVIEGEFARFDGGFDG